MSLLKSQVRRTAEVHSPSKSARSEGLPFKQAIEIIDRAVGNAQALIITTLPRGTTQIAQPANLPETLLRGYAREFHADDVLTWKAIAGAKPLTAVEAGGDGRFVQEHLAPNGYAYAAAAPLLSPVLWGYPGAVHVYRSKDQGPFSVDELQQLGNAARQIDSLLDDARSARHATDAGNKINLSSRPSRIKLFAIDQNGRALLTGEFTKFDQAVQNTLIDLAKSIPAKLNDADSFGKRVQIADAHHDMLVFRVVGFAHHPLAGGNAATLFCMQPTAAEWAAVRPADLQADPEIARLIPALRFMRQEFHRGPTLSEIAQQVHLSPFHFHRRFAELLGMTPKHYLLECQITQAKMELLGRKKDLSQIATDCGFAHQSHFTSRFKQATGLTPTRWRRVAESQRTA